ncbi:xanthine dehydrogenase family protein molybdopterin-binding subunit [Dehalobacter restrictus]|jgi:4-hydroxybenzoyl-CoA reductase alpha subunit|uniref:4-hydroxybenzoyl-CoA reductase subunit alpha n=1 Tax=Dehalobacter restrictus (strain DSM 9455 / PER-K23) TaxID=871738 RepID=A0ABN4BSV8_DEHRP|nr:molybdopterin cofactor-binding domain-containing protein [Dehalobacter restrictus]AHF10463.1 4-hydroxybenzoyl-CoA reductase subunit alpha [Dehalobacter restrictus DSM 9455]
MSANQKKDENFSIVGTNYSRVDAEAKVTGHAQYTGDIHMTGMLYGKFLRSPHAHAKIISIDTSKAEAYPGVKAIITGDDFNAGRLGNAEFAIQLADKYPLAKGKVRLIGDEVAAIAAIDEETAEAAAKLIEVEYEVLPAVITPEEAMKDEAPTIHVHEIVKNNIGMATSLKCGDVDSAFKDAEYTDKYEYDTHIAVHAALEPHAAVATYENGEYTLWSTTQTASVCRFWIANALGVPETQVRVIKPFIGGGFGGKLDQYPHEACCCVLAQKTGRPVKMVLTREEVFFASRTRHAIKIGIKTAFKKDGTILAKRCDHILDGGAYGGTGMPATALSLQWATCPYKIPNMDYFAKRVYTNHCVAGAQRGYSAVQVHFANEVHMDEVAEALEIDPIALRKMNAMTPGYDSPAGLEVTSCAFTETLDAASDYLKWNENKNNLPEGEGIGFGGSGFVSGTGFPILNTPAYYSACVIVRLNRQGYATVFTGSNDIGQGSDTVMTLIAAEELGLNMNEVKIVVSDTTLSPFDSGTYGSRVTFLTGNATRRAAVDAKRQLIDTVARKLGVDAGALICKDHRIFVEADPTKGMSYGEAVFAYQEENGGKEVVGVGAYAHKGDKKIYMEGKTNFAPAYSFSTGGAKVKVDEETGIVDIEDFVFAHDCGRPLNVRAVEGQIEGSVQMGLGYVLFEECKISADGKLLNPSFRDYRFPTALDMPRIKTILCGEPDAEGPFGAKECGEGSTAPVAPAIVNAVSKATGIHFRKLPLTPENVWKELQEQQKNK